MSAYLDHAATTPLDPRVREAMAPFWAEPLNASSIHRQGQRARRLLEDARARLAEALGLDDSAELVFTSGATESANLALRGLALAKRAGEPLRVLTSPLEHSCISETLEVLAAQSRARLGELLVAPSGRAELPAPKLEHPPELLCLMHANNETGVMQPVEEARAWRDRNGCLWLCDASQTVGKMTFCARSLGADLFFATAHKFGGPQGIGFLAGPALPRLVPQLSGGPQERELRAGTTPVALAQGMAAALEVALADLAEMEVRLRRLEEGLLVLLRGHGFTFHRNGEPPTLAGFLNLSFPGWSAADLTIALDAEGIQVSPGAACTTGVVATSPVLAAMFPSNPDRAASGIRLSFGKETCEEDIKAFVQALLRIASRSRNPRPGGGFSQRFAIPPLTPVGAMHDA